MNNIDMLVEKYVTAYKKWDNTIEVFVNPTKRELRDTVNSVGELRFIADSKNKKVYVFPRRSMHAETWNNHISKEIGDSRRMYADETLFGGAIEGGKVVNWGFEDNLYNNNVLAEWILHPDVWKFAQKWFDIQGWIEEQEPTLTRKGSRS